MLVGANSTADPGASRTVVTPKKTARIECASTTAPLTHTLRRIPSTLPRIDQREKDHYDLGVVKRIFIPGNLVRVKL